MAKRKSIVRGISREVTRRAKSEVESQRNLVRSRIRTRIERFIPLEIRWLIPFLQQYKPELEEEKVETLPETPVAVAELRRKVPPVGEPFYTEYACVFGNPLSCDRTLNSSVKYCSECGFPAALPQKAEIRGSKGRYRIESFLEQRGLGRLYQGMQISDNQQVVIKEYLLPDHYFNLEEAGQRKEVFARVAGVNLADGRVQDFRLIHPWDAIADANEERCYLVTKGNLDFYSTLREYLALYGAMSAANVRQALNQVLQTLECLHGQKFRLPSGQVQKGLTHGNINLDSLLIAKVQPSNSNGKNGFITNGLNSFTINNSTMLESEFFIYTCDLALWEHLFNPSNSQSFNPSPAKDLVDLGYVAFYLLAGNTINPVTRQPLNPRDDEQWPPIDLPLKSFILRLMGLSVPFESAEAARQALLKLPNEQAIAELITPVIPEDEEKRKTPRILWFLLGILGLSLLGWLAWFLLSKSQKFENASDDVPLCCMKDVSGVPAGKFTYTAEQEGTWNYVLKQKNLVEKGQTLEQELAKRQPKLQLSYQPEPSGEAAIEKVKLGRIDFAMSSLVSNLTSELDYQEIGYDGLVLFVNFSYAKREQGLPEALKGKITFENLRKLYTGQIYNWKQLGGPNLPVRVYIPTETEAVRIFEQRVLKDEQQISLFRSLIREDDQPTSLFKYSWMPEVRRVSTFKMLRRVIQDFENDRVGAIAFGTFSKVFGQCSVYPLALVDGKNSPVQALIQDNGQPVAPTTDLCNDKGSYRPNLEVFKTGRYPLAYPLAVVYSRDNSRPPAGRKFAEILRTQEGQQLLGKTGLVPLYPIPRN